MVTPTPTSGITPKPCSADFIGEPRVGEGTTTVQFTDKSTGNVTAWAWDFNNDGTVDSTQQNPTNVYNKDGNYTVTLTITTPNCENKTTKPDYISITGCKT
jgi:PKD repeat protein